MLSPRVGRREDTFKIHYTDASRSCILYYYTGKLTFIFSEYLPNAMTQAGTKAMHRMITFVAIMMEFFVSLEKRKTDGTILRIIYTCVYYVYTVKI